VRHDILEVNQEALAEAIEAAGYPVSHKATEGLADESECLSCHSRNNVCGDEDHAA
jgi:hypothetical protein